ncbi:MAG: hypothetical protein RJQ07_05565 [Pseudomonadales bacterium]
MKPPPLQQQTRQRLTAFALLTVLLMRVAIPAGLMPNQDGWFLKICPDGMPARVAAVFGDEHAHHHQPDNELSAQCDLSGPALQEITLPISTPATADFRALIVRPEFDSLPYHSSPWQQKPARAPPSDIFA